MTQDKKSLLTNKDFLFVWVGQTISVLGDTLFNLAMMWWVVATTGSGTAMSGVALATALPRIILGPVAGVYVDRLDRRKLMMVANALNGLVAFFMALLFVQGIFSLTIILVSSLIMGIISTVHMPTFEATIPSLVNKDELVRVNSIMQSANSIVGLVSPAISGVLIGLAGVGAAIIANAATFFVAAVSLLWVTIPSPRVQPRRSNMLSEAVVGFKFIGTSRLLLPMLIFFAVINLSLSPMSVAMPLLVVNVLKGGPALMGLFGSFQSGGILAASSLLALAPGLLKRTGLTLVAAIIGIGVGVSVVGLVASTYTFLGGAAIMGVMLIVANVASQSIWQREVPEEVRGRVFAARHTFSSALRPLGLAIAGPLVDWVGPSALLSGAGVLCIVAGVCGMLLSTIVTYPSSTHKVEIAQSS